MSALPTPEFIPTDVLARLAEAIRRFEQAIGQPLYPAQPERLTLNALTYEINLLATQLDLALRRQLVEYAEYPVLDHLARFYGIARLPPCPARTTVKITRNTADRLLILPAKTKLGGAASFTTDEDLTFPFGIFEARVSATCATQGAAYNGLALGQINVFQEVLPGLRVENLTETRDGADLESDAALRRRVLLAPEAFTVAGSREAYEARAREVSPAILAAGVSSPRPGEIEITILTDKGLPGPELIAAVQTHLSDRSIRPMGDSVTVRPPRPHPYSIAASLTLRRDADLEPSLAAAKAAAEAYKARQAKNLGGDLVPNEIRAALFVPGIYDVALTEPPGAVLTPSDWPFCQAISLSIAGRADE